MRELNIAGGLTKVARSIGIDRIGTMHQAGSDAHLTSALFFQLRAKLKQLWLIDTEEKIQERFNGKINGIGDSINEEAYIWEYKLSAKELQYIDSTGYINLHLKELRENNGAGVA
jgi:hypothetical protein